jgi:hypothetical protein
MPDGYDCSEESSSRGTIPDYGREVESGYGSPDNLISSALGNSISGLIILSTAMFL